MPALPRANHDNPWRVNKLRVSNSVHLLQNDHFRPSVPVEEINFGHAFRETNSITSGFLCLDNSVMQLSQIENDPLRGVS